MEILVCLKRVPAPGASVPLTADERDIDTRHLGFTIGPHEECAVEEAVRLAARHGGHVTVLAAGTPESAEQLRYALAMGANHAILADTGPEELDPEATATALVHAIRVIGENTPSPDRLPYDLVLFGDSSADASHFQVGIRVATELGLPIVGGIKGIDLEMGELEIGAVEMGAVRLRRDVGDGVEVYRLPLPAAAAVREGLNLPRYPNLPGRLRAKKATVRTISVEPHPGGLRKVRLHQPVDRREDAVMLGNGADAAPAVVDVLHKLGVV